MTTYKEMTFEGQVNSVLRDGKTVILLDTGSQEEQAYLKWLEEGNTPEPADN